MSELIKISLGSLALVANGLPVEGQAGVPTATATVVGAGTVSATVVVRGSNDGVAWVPLATLSPTGTGAGVASGSWSGDYAQLRADVTAISAGASVSTSVSVDQTLQTVEQSILTRPVAVVLGDSQSENGEVVSGIYNIYSSRGYWAHCLAEVKWPFEVAAVSGFPGETTQQILARFDDAVTPYRPAYVIYLPGQNNLLDADNGAAGIEALRQIALRCKDIGALLILGTTTPRYGAFHSSQAQRNVVAFHRAVAALAREGLALPFDAGRAVTDPASATGSALAGLLYDQAIAGIHLGAKAGLRIAKQFARDLAGKLPANPFPPPLSNVDCRQINASSKQLVGNPKVTGTAGTVSTANGPASGVAPGDGTAVGNWQLQLARSTGGAATITVVGAGNVADAQDTGRLWYQMTFGGTNDGAGEDLAILNISAQFSAMQAAVNAGVDALDYARVTIKGSNVSSNFSYAKLQIEALNGSNPLFEWTCMAESANDPQGEFSSSELVFHAPGGLIPATTTRLRVNIKIAFKPGATTGVFSVTDFDVRMK